MSENPPQVSTYHARQANRNSEDGISLSELGELLNARKGIILFAASIVALLTLLHHVMRPSYEARTALLVQRPQNSPLQAMMGKMAGTAAGGMSRSNEYQDKFAAYLSSHEFRVNAARRMIELPQFEEDRIALTKKGLLGRLIKAVMYVQITDPASADTQVEELARALRVVQFQKSGFDNIVLQTKMANYARAVRLVNFLSDVAVESVTRREVAELDSAKEFLEREMAKANANLQQVDESIVDFRKKSNNVVTDTAPLQLLTNINAIQKNLDANRLKFDLNSKLATLLEKELKEDSRQILTTGAKNLKSSDVIKELFRKIQDLRYRRIMLLAQGESEQSEDIATLDNSIAYVAQQIRAESAKHGGTDEDVSTLLQDKDGLIGKIHTLKRENQYLETQAETLRKGLAAARAPLKTLPAEVQTLASFGRDAQTEFYLFGQMKNRVLELELEKVSVRNKIAVVEKATIAGIAPRLNFLPKMVIAFLLTSIFGAMAAYGVEFMDTTVKGRADLVRLGLVHLGSIPQINEPTRLALQRALYRWTGWKRFLVPDINTIKAWLYNPDAPEVMAFNHVRERIWKMKDSAGRSAKVVAITSSKQGEGKSYIASNLAFSLAQLERKILLVDCDFRRSTLDKRLGLSKAKGLSTILTRGAPLDECLSVNLVPGLDVLTTGPSVKKPTELISSSKFSTFLDSLRDRYDYIVLDTPPILPVVDSLVISSLADAVVLATSYRKTQVSNLEASLEKLEQAQLKSVYAILNHSPKVNEYVYVATQPREPRTTSSPGSGGPLNIKEELERFRETLPSGST